MMDLGFADDAQAALDSAAPEAAEAAGALRPSSLPAPVDRLMSLIFDVEMMQQVPRAPRRRATAGALRRAPGGLACTLRGRGTGAKANAQERARGDFARCTAVMLRPPSSSG